MDYRYRAKKKFFSSALARDLAIGQVITTKNPIPETEAMLFELLEQQETVAPIVKPKREDLEKQILKRKLLKADQLAGLSIDQLVQILSKPEQSMELLLKEAVDKELGDIETLEKLNREQLTALINGAK